VVIHSVVMVFTLPKPLFDTYKVASNLISNYHGTIRVFTHYDADGIGSAGILAKTLYRMGKNFHLTCRKNLDDEFFSILQKEKNKLLIIADMGTNDAFKIKQHTDYLIILDHHQPTEEIIQWHNSLANEVKKEKDKLLIEEKMNLEARNMVILNSHLFGLNGTSEACASTMCFVLSIVCDEANWDMLPFALAGAEGDRQNSDGQFYGINRQILDEGLARGIIKRNQCFAFDGVSLYDAISVSNDPFFLNFVKNPDKLEEMLKKLGIEKNANISNLTAEQFKMLASALALEMLRQDVHINAVMTLCQYDFFGTNGVRVKTLANYLNSCGRLGKSGKGIGLFFDFEKYEPEASKVRDEYRTNVRKYLLQILDGGVTRMRGCQYFWVDLAEYAGSIGGLALTYMLDKSVPVFVLSRRDKVVSISSRGLPEHVKSGLNLGLVCKNAAEQCGGHGGGHTIAAGAEVPEGKENDFLKYADEMICKQMQI